MQSYLEQAFGKSDVTTPRMRAALREWLDLYYGAPRPGEDPAPRLAALIVAKLCRTVFAEYEARLDADAGDWLRRSLAALDAAGRTAVQYALIGGECLLKPVPAEGALDFVPIRRDCYVPLARDAHGRLLAVGTMEQHSRGGVRYALLERRTAGAEGLTIETRLFELNGQALGRCVPLSALEACAGLLTRYGGHAAAAGLTLEEERLPAFRSAVNRWAAERHPRPEPPVLELDAPAAVAELTLDEVGQLERLAPFGGGNHQPLFFIQDAVVDGVWPMGAEKRHSRIRLRQGQATCFASLFGTPPEDLPYRVGTAVDAAVEAGIFNGRNGPGVSLHIRAMRPAGMGDGPCRQAALLDDFLAGRSLTPDQAAALSPTRADTVALYRLVQSGAVFAEDLQPTFAALGAENAGKALVSLEALRELGLVERRGARWMPAAVSGKKDLTSAPILRRMAAMAAQDNQERG